MGSTVASDSQSSALSARVGPRPLGPLKLRRRRRAGRIAPLAPGLTVRGPTVRLPVRGPAVRFLGTQGQGRRAQGSGRRRVRGDSFRREPGAGSREPGAGSREPGAGSREPGAGRGTGPGIPPDRTDRRPDTPARGIQNGRSLAAYPGQSWEHGSRLPGWIRMNVPRPGNVLLCEAHTRIKRNRGHAATMRIRQGRARPIPPPVL
jgi:hypothetical protein